MRPQDHVLPINFNFKLLSSILHLVKQKINLYIDLVLVHLVIKRPEEILVYLETKHFYLFKSLCKIEEKCQTLV